MYSKFVRKKSKFELYSKWKHKLYLTLIYYKPRLQSLIVS